jgi:hypothetical protein
VVAVPVRDHRQIYRFPGIDIKFTRNAVNAFVGNFDEGFGFHKKFGLIGDIFGIQKLHLSKREQFFKIKNFAFRAAKI